MATEIKKYVLTGPDIRNQLMRMVEMRQAQPIYLVAPYLNIEAERLLARTLLSTVRVLTSFELDDFVNGASDLKAIRNLLANPKVQVRHSECLHAKIFLTNRSAIVGSANLTFSGLTGRNQELALRSTDMRIVVAVREHVEELWENSDFLEEADVIEMQKNIDKVQKEKDALDEKMDGIIDASRGLQFFPEEGRRYSDYYAQMLSYLEVVAEKESGCPIADLHSHMRNSSQQDGSDLPQRRASFLRKLKLIKPTEEDVVVLTEIGVGLLSRTNSKRLQFFKRLLIWCEERQDYQFRTLLRTVPSFGNETFTLEQWQRRIKPYGEGRSSRWFNCNVRKMQNPQFVNKTANARAWLVSLGIVGRCGNKYHKVSNPPYGHDVEQWMDKITSKK